MANISEQLIASAKMVATGVGLSAVIGSSVYGWHKMAAPDVAPELDLAHISVRSRIPFLRELESVMTEERLTELNDRFAEDREIINQMRVDRIIENPSSTPGSRSWGVYPIYESNPTQGTDHYYGIWGPPSAPISNKEMDEICIEFAYAPVVTTIQDIRSRGFLEILPEDAINDIYRSNMQNSPIQVVLKHQECFHEDGSHRPVVRVEFDILGQNSSTVYKLWIEDKNGSMTHSYSLVRGGLPPTFTMPSQYESQVGEFINTYKNALKTESE